MKNKNKKKDICKFNFVNSKCINILPNGSPLGTDLIPLTPGVLPPVLVGVTGLGRRVVDFSIFQNQITNKTKTKKLRLIKTFSLSNFGA